ncbi:FAD binding domain protein [Daldinia sp. FL1419]|nr:FAD binding domain protein [Daldinia sp. FL1419]
MGEKAKARSNRNLSRVVKLTSLVTILVAAWLATSQPSFNTFRRPRCRCFPGDPCWPSSDEWNSFNNTIRGRLIATVPIASPCHDTFPGVSYDADKCAEIRANWGLPKLHYESAHSPMAHVFTNMSCDPFTTRDAQCTVGNYIAYAVNAPGVLEYRETLNFAKKRNIRLVIRNTGHDYMGKSTGAGALAIWTHNIKLQSILDYTSPVYTGKAMKIGAGVLSSEAQATAKTNGFVIAQGDCPSVGIAGGFTQGGGTGPLASKVGLAADQVLEWEVVTGNADFLIATPDRNSDLYWALSGGGGGTYGVVLSMTVKLYTNMPTAGATLHFADPTDLYWDIVQAFLVHSQTILEAGATIYWQVLPGNKFQMSQSYLPNGTARDLEQLLQPTLQVLKQGDISYTFSSWDFPNFQDAFDKMDPGWNIAEMSLGGRIIPRSLVASKDSAASLVNAIKSIIGNSGIFIGVSMDVRRPPSSPNAVHPYWRESLFLAFLGTMYDRYNMTLNSINHKLVTDSFVPAPEAITPGGAAYLNEGDYNQPNWQNVFYGTNYRMLLSIKQKYDPDGIFWGPTAVGSENWRIVEHGRLCAVN